MMGSSDEGVSTGAQEDSLNIFLHPDDDSKSQLSSTDPGEFDMDTMKEVGVQVPTHPIPSMQEAFAESMLEASGRSTPSPPKPSPGDAATRRKILIEQEISEETHAARWLQKPGQQYHQLWKLMAQISFGMYLLLNGIARDDEQVMNILQGHVDEVDEWLETTLEDFDLAQEDIDERLKFLKLPLENIHVFDAMLEDRAFRLQIVSGNEKIEHVITRTARAMNDALKDVQQGMDACKEFTIYLAEEQDQNWRQHRPDMEKVFDAMKGNVDGWYKAYVLLQTKGNHLGVALVQLGSIVAEMDRRAGEVSRKTRFSSASNSPGSPPPVSPPQRRASRQLRLSMSKILPTDPNMITPAIAATLPAFQLVQERERTPEPEKEVCETHLESDSEKEAIEEEEPQFILAPRTYTPVPPSPALPEVIQPEDIPPEFKKRSSLRKRFSLKRKEESQSPPTASLVIDDGYWGPTHRAYSVNDNAQRPKLNKPAIISVNSPSNRMSPRMSPITIAPQREGSIATPPSRGMDSAYCSDFEKQPLTPRLGVHPAHLPTSNNNSPKMYQNARIPTPPVLTRDFIPTPRSEQQQYFRPVNASPNSPLQRPWTAAPTAHHMHKSSNLSNLSKLSSGSTARFPNPAAMNAAMGQRRNAPSAMGMSVMSDMTTVTENGMKVKKKRSAFGWLKKAFSLSEEEKQAFEERRRRQDESLYYEKPRQRWVDGKRIDEMPRRRVVR